MCDPGSAIEVMKWGWGGGGGDVKDPVRGLNGGKPIR